jgi:hypothetical protein
VSGLVYTAGRVESSMSHRSSVEAVLIRQLTKIVEEEKARVPRVFVVNELGLSILMSHADYYTHTGVSQAAQAAFDIMDDDGVPAEQAWQFALIMDKTADHRGDAEAQARHFVKLRKVMREVDVP